jgi:anaerobic dimethyl sulfoxide reductase subunit B (iron-sulfur subunit)
MTYAFTFDASSCSGCKACQVACKDKNNLPTGVLWRRVYEISGGTWTAQDEAWTTDVFAYNLSIACNHCVHPKCAGVCPVDAYVVREDGIVYIDETKCMGCGYCAWACPYSAPRYNPEVRHMTKCNFCFDNIDAGLPPACVAACPMRVLDFVEVESKKWEDESKTPLWDMPGTEHPFPLPTFSRTQPHLALNPHAGMLNGLEKTISNREEIQTSAKSPKPFTRFALADQLKELPLVLFTLLAQMAVGAFWSQELLYIAFFNYWDYFKKPAFDELIPSYIASNLTNTLMFAIGIMLAFAGLASFLHLGTPKNAWRALNHLEKSWLSREILFFGLFSIGWASTLVWQLIYVELLREPVAWVTFTLGVGLVHSMANVYRLRAMPAWNTWRTPAAFFLSALVLGRALTAAALAWDVLNNSVWQAGSLGWMGISMAILLGLGWALSAGEDVPVTVKKLRGGLSALGMAGGLSLFFVPAQAAAWLAFPILLVIFIEEGLGRWLFYEKIRERVL